MIILFYLLIVKSETDNMKWKRILALLKNMKFE
jgi:hypothetical protein